MASSIHGSLGGFPVPPPELDSYKNASDTRLSNRAKIKTIRGREVHLRARQSHKQDPLDSRNLEVQNVESIKMLTWKRLQKSDLKKTRFSHSHKPKIIGIGSVVMEKSQN